MNKLAALLVALTVLMVSTTAHATTVYDLAADWSATNNPHGA